LLAIHQDYTAKADALEAEGESAMTQPDASSGAEKHGSGAGS
jgi:hypothetical protein